MLPTCWRCSRCVGSAWQAANDRTNGTHCLRRRFEVGCVTGKHGYTKSGFDGTSQLRKRDNIAKL